MDGVRLSLARPDEIDAATLARYRSWLTPDERAARFATPALEREWLVTRGLSRTALSEAVPDVAPEDWRFDRDEAGKPFVTGPRAIHFNLANTPGLVACAVAADPVGVDVEHEDRVVTDAVLAPAERARLAALAPEQRRIHAVELWTIKEAYLKARGTGISLRLDRLDTGAIGHPWEVSRIPPFVVAIAVIRSKVGQ